MAKKWCKTCLLRDIKFATVMLRRIHSAVVKRLALRREDIKYSSKLATLDLIERFHFYFFFSLFTHHRFSIKNFCKSKDYANNLGKLNWEKSLKCGLSRLIWGTSINNVWVLWVFLNRMLCTVSYYCCPSFLEPLIRIFFIVC